MSHVRTIALASIPFLAALSVHAESYDGVHDATSTRTRQEVALEAEQATVMATQGFPPESRSLSFVSTADPAALRLGAIAAINAPDANVVPGSRVNSRVISTMDKSEYIRAQQHLAASGK